MYHSARPQRHTSKLYYKLRAKYCSITQSPAVFDKVVTPNNFAQLSSIQNTKDLLYWGQLPPLIWQLAQVLISHTCTTTGLLLRASRHVPSDYPNAAQHARQVT